MTTENDSMEWKKIVKVLAVLAAVYLGAYCSLRISKVLVHQEVALVNRTDATKDGRHICYFMHQDIGHGSFTDSDNYNKINTPGIAVRAGKCFFYPLVKIEVSYYRLTRPTETLETVCQQ